MVQAQRGFVQRGGLDLGDVAFPDLEVEQIAGVGQLVGATGVDEGVRLGGVRDVGGVVDEDAVHVVAAGPDGEVVVRQVLDPEAQMVAFGAGVRAHEVGHRGAQLVEQDRGLFVAVGVQADPALEVEDGRVVVAGREGDVREVAVHDKSP